MLFGSRSGLIAPAPGGSAGVVVAEGGGTAPGVSSSTGAAGFGGSLLQATSSVTSSALRTSFLMTCSFLLRLEWIFRRLTLRQGTPGGLAHIAGGGDQTLLDAAIAGYGC